MNHEPSRKAKFVRLKKAAAAGSPALAILLASRFVATFPDDGPGWVVPGRELYGLGRYEEAERALRKALDLCPQEKRDVVLANVGHMARAAGKHESAAEWFKRAIEADPDDASGYIHLGGLLASQGRLAEAEEFHRWATLCPDGCIDEAFLNLGLVLRAQERFGEAAQCFREAIAIDPEYRDAKKALRDVERCLKLS